MNAFKVNAGLHIDGRTGKQYKKGEVVHSDDNLCTMFPEKFTDLGDVDDLPKKKKIAPATASESNPPVTEEEPKGTKSPAGKGKKGDTWD